VDRYLELIRPSWTLSDARAELTEVRRQPAAVTLTLAPNDAWAGFSAGQFVQISVEIDGVRRSRCYSPSCAEGLRDEIEITVKRHPEGLVSGYLNENATPGMVVGLSAAGGDFVLPAQRPEELLLISGGSGITPVLSILRTLCAEGHQGPVTFIHYAPTEAEALYRSELEQIAERHSNLRLLRSYTREAGRGELDGHFSHAQLARAAPVFPEAETFVCGPPGLVEDVRSTWAKEGLEARLHIESFLPPALAIASETAEGEVHFTDANQRVPNDGRPLLEQAEAAGLRPDFGCRMGICHTCTCRKTAGSVRNVLSGEVSSAEDEEIQICVSAPVGDVALEL